MTDEFGHFVNPQFVDWAIAVVGMVGFAFGVVAGWEIRRLWRRGTT